MKKGELPSLNPQLTYKKTPEHWGQKFFTFEISVLFRVFNSNAPPAEIASDSSESRVLLDFAKALDIGQPQFFSWVILLGEVFPSCCFWERLQRLFCVGFCLGFDLFGHVKQ